MANAQLLEWPETLPRDMLPELRSDHAGETGAVQIYRGILAVTRDPELREFALQHLQSETRHLGWMEQLLPANDRSRLLPLWRLAGWLTGALPALFGPAAVYRTIDAVETFVDRHYSAQIATLQDRESDLALRNLLEACRADEIDHRDDARSRLGPAGVIGRCWTRLVGAGSHIGVVVASRI